MKSLLKGLIAIPIFLVLLPSYVIQLIGGEDLEETWLGKFCIWLNNGIL
jgi:hypothetical protein